ncbi:hypothetical protein V6N13_068891 [Hibiscus sabdariffa]|uniref:Transcription factor CBF/NF-Y/archaeal histone domain-containing protein n=1 Tax=Hibiscus sabdariffa TaxID=183260 RepID=A0ABR2QNX6_9ROSI
MERGDGSNRSHKLAKSSSGSSRHGDIPNLNSNSDSNNSNTTPPAVREQDRFMPIANVIRIMRRVLPPYAKISDDAKESILECISEFISFITGEANEHCRVELRKTVTAEDMFFAMENLGFDNYVDPLTIFLNRYREAENDRTSLRGELVLRRGIDHGSMMMPPLNNPAFQATLRQRFLDAATTSDGLAGGYNQDVSGTAAAGSSSQAATNNFDPSGQFK